MLELSEKDLQQIIGGMPEPQPGGGQSWLRWNLG
jgi:bacteriocin-like protein